MCIGGKPRRRRRLSANNRIQTYEERDTGLLFTPPAGADTKYKHDSRLGERDKGPAVGRRYRKMAGFSSALSTVPSGPRH